MMSTPQSNDLKASASPRRESFEFRRMLGLEGPEHDDLLLDVPSAEVAPDLKVDSGATADKDALGEPIADATEDGTHASLSTAVGVTEGVRLEECVAEHPSDRGHEAELTEENIEAVLQREVCDDTSTAVHLLGADGNGTAEQVELLLADVPQAARSIIEQVRVPHERLRVLVEFERETFQWVGRERHRDLGDGAADVISLDRVKVQETWKRLVAGRRRKRHFSRLKVLVDDARARLHAANIVSGSWPETLPEAVLDAEVKDGVLVVRDPEGRDGQPGDAAYLEQTPPPVFVVGAQLTRRHFESAGKRWQAPSALDPMAGSGTGEATLGPLGWKVLSSDLTNPGERIHFLDARNVGEHALHQRVPKIDGKQPGPIKVPEHLVVDRPHMIVLDPPSRGTPTHAERYEGFWPNLDLAVLDRNEYIETIAAISGRALECLRAGGCLVLVVREGTRSQQHVSADPDLARDIVAAIGQAAEVVDTFKVVYEHARNQFSLRKARLPIRVFLLARAG